jgi:hypothetical protein
MEFNNHVSMLRIRSEHAIGFLKGRFHSLKGLRVRILDERSHKFATYWVAACIGLHAFAMQCEDEEDSQSDDLEEMDAFIAEGLSSSESDSETNTAPETNARTAGRSSRLYEGRARREQLRHRLFRAKDTRERGQSSNSD